MGSGNGYWTYMLRRLEQGKKALHVTPVDNGLSEWRTMWIADTVELDGVKWLHQHSGAKDALLLLVYPNTGEEFTSKMIKAYSKSWFYFFRLLLLNDFDRRFDDRGCQLTECLRIHCVREGNYC
jgi:hypothetical protein